MAAFQAPGALVRQARIALLHSSWVLVDCFLVDRRKQRGALALVRTTCLKQIDESARTDFNRSPSSRSRVNSSTSSWVTSSPMLSTAPDLKTASPTPPGVSSGRPCSPQHARRAVDSQSSSTRSSLPRPTAQTLVLFVNPSLWTLATCRAA